MSAAMAAAVPAAAEGVLLTRTVDGRRSSVNDCYLEPARGRGNLTVLGDALVDRVLLDGRRAVGVLLADGLGPLAAEQRDADVHGRPPKSSRGRGGPSTPDDPPTVSGDSRRRSR